MRVLVLDASLGVKWFLDEPDSKPARDILGTFVDSKKRFLVPELFYYEVYSVCCRRHPDPDKFTSQGMAWLFSLPLKRIVINAELARLGREFTRKGLTGYDACYAALAVMTKGSWLTYDVAAAKQLGNPNWVEVLSKYRP